ncbi:LysE family translocator [Variovorax sp. IB41]|uniref:LysE family translocator n=1 Tax=Variovorax sp. IB41 TaxID=2779370 RepID=UPI0018E70FDB|nr:LysE family translocator [Variovorax sp. IB41]MBJ2158263.1 LysE family translocator [Variovorax sp. IB41]
MDSKLILIFALAAFFEAVTPGPTMALVLETRTSAGIRGALLTVAGITVANIVWVACVLLLFLADAKWFGEWIGPFIKYFGAAYLVYLASRRLLSAVVQFITHRDDREIAKQSGANLFWTGFIAHAGNPLSISYYLATFGVVIMSMSLTEATIYGAIPIVMDAAVFVLLAIAFGEKKHLAGRWARLLAGLVLFFLVGHVYSNSPALNSEISVTPLMTFIMLGGFFYAAIAESRSEVALRKDKNNKMLWRVVGLWGVWFSAAAIFGGFYTLIGGFAMSAFSLEAVQEHRLRICFVVAAVIGSALSFAKACGELQDDQATQPATGPAIKADGWQTSPYWIGAFAFGFLGAVFVLLTVIGFNVR